MVHQPPSSRPVSRVSFVLLYSGRGDDAIVSGLRFHRPICCSASGTKSSCSEHPLEQVDSLGCSTYTATACVMVTLDQGSCVVDCHHQHTLPEGDRRPLLLIPGTSEQEVHNPPTRPGQQLRTTFSIDQKVGLEIEAVDERCVTLVSSCRVDGPHRDSTTLCTSHRQLKTFRATASLAKVLVIQQC